MEIFKLKPLKEPSFFQKLFKKEPSENAFIEVNNLLAKNQSDIEKISLDNIIEISNKYKTNLKHKFKRYRIELFSDFLHYCLVDDKLEDFEVKQLEHLRDILMLKMLDVDEIIKKETEKIYEKHVREAVSDGILEDFEKENLEKLKADLLISEEVATEIYGKNAKDILQRFIDGAISDERISPDEENQMNKIARSLGIDLEIDEKSTAELESYKLYWQIENSELPEIIPEINIQKSEKLHFSTYVSWLEQRRVTKRMNYGGPTARIKLAKGVYYRAGSLGVQKVSEDVWQTIDSGQIYLTNKRLIFMGEKGNKTIRINKILDINPYSNGVDIQKETGKNPFLDFSDNVDIFSMILVSLMDEQ
tara:strand:+ start:85 stop:1170 length:1086 start_codon:yes stop_codon:yes gene_type:complete